MNSARRIIEGAGSFWREVAPLLPNFVKRVNLGVYDRMDQPIRSGTDRNRHFLINEIAFDAWADRNSGVTVDIESTYERHVQKWKSRLPDSPHLDSKLSSSERAELTVLLARLEQYQSTYRIEKCDFRVLVPALGRLEMIEVDFMSPMLLGEVKAGERPFRSIDFRQLLLSVLALNINDAGHELMLINPREGIVWRENTQEFVETVSVRPYGDFLHDATFYLCESGLSV